MPAPHLYAYLSHRVLKWLTPFTLLLAGLFFTGAVLMAVPLVDFLFALAIAVGVSIAGLTFGVGPFRLAGMALLSLSGVGAGVLQSIFTGRTYTVWEPAKSVRSDV